MYQPIFFTILRLALLAFIGFILFKPEKIRRHLLKPVMFIIMNVLFPLHFVWSLPLGWDKAVEAGIYWMPVFFFAALFMIGFQTLLSRLFVRPKGLLDTEQPRSMTALFSIHNAGYIPLPIMVALAPQEVNIYLFMYFLGFNLIFWSAAIHLVKAESKGFTFKLNPPLVGIIIGMIIAIFDLFPYIPDIFVPLLEFSGAYSLDLMMMLLGAVLATIPRSDFVYRPEFGRLIGIRLLLYPLAMLGVAALLPLSGLSEELQWGLRLVLVVEAAVPPATNLLLAAKLFGSTSQVHYIGSGIMFTYLSVIITLPIFLIAATFLFR